MRGRPIDAAFPKRALGVTGAGAAAVAAAVQPAVDAVGGGVGGVVPQAAAMSTLDGTFSVLLIWISSSRSVSINHHRIIAITIPSDIRFPRRQQEEQ